MNFDPKDHFYKKAKQDNYLARSVYKLEEIDKKYNLIRPEDQVIDLGCYPGSWAQYFALKLSSKGSYMGVDIQDPTDLHAKFPPNFSFYCGDVLDEEFLKRLSKKSFHGVVSDMAPSTSGIKTVDQAKSMELVEVVWDFAQKYLAPEGYLIFKVFEGGELNGLIRTMQKKFQKIARLRPASTRKSSKEIFVIGIGYKA